VSEMIFPSKSHAAGAQSFRRLAAGAAPFRLVLKSRDGPFLEYLRPNVGITMPALKVVPVFEEDGA